MVLISPQMRHWNLCPSIWMYSEALQPLDQPQTMTGFSSTLRRRFLLGSRNCRLLAIRLSTSFSNNIGRGICQDYSRTMAP